MGEDSSSSAVTPSDIPRPALTVCIYSQSTLDSKIKCLLTYILSQVTVWVFFALTAFLLICRLFIRAWLHRQLYWDDVFAIVAFVFLLGQLITISIISPAVYYFVDVKEGMAHSHEFDDQFTTMMKGLLAHAICYAICIYLVKASFMSLFWRLVRNIETFRKLWWVITIVCAVSFCVTIALFPIACSNFQARMWTPHTQSPV